MSDIEWFPRHYLSPDAERDRRLQRAIKILQDYKSGRPLSDIRKEYDINNGMIFRYLRLAGYNPKRKVQELSEAADRHESILRRYTNGESIAAIAKAEGCSQSLVSQLASRRGIQRRKFKMRLT